MHKLYRIVVQRHIPSHFGVRFRYSTLIEFVSIEKVCKQMKKQFI